MPRPVQIEVYRTKHGKLVVAEFDNGVVTIGISALWLDVREIMDKVRREDGESRSEAP